MRVLRSDRAGRRDAGGRRRARHHRFLGGRSQVDFQNRLARPSATNAPAGAYTVTETVRLRAYVLGIRVKNARYRAEETLLPDGRLVRQILTNPDGGTITLERIAE